MADESWAGIESSCPHCSELILIPGSGKTAQTSGESSDADCSSTTQAEGESGGCDAVSSAPETTLFQATNSIKPPQLPPPAFPGASVYLAINGIRSGPYSDEEVEAGVTQGLIAGDTLVWKTGFADWKAVTQMFPSALPERPTPTDPSVRVDMIPEGASNRRVRLAMVSVMFGGLVPFVAIFGIPLLAAVPAIIAGRMACIQIRKSEERLKGKGMAFAGIIAGCLGVLLQVFIYVNGPGSSSVRRSNPDYARDEYSGDDSELGNGGGARHGIALSGVYLEAYNSRGAGMNFSRRITWDFRSDGSVHQSETVAGIAAGGEGTYSVAGNTVTVTMEDGDQCSFGVEANGDLVSHSSRNYGGRLVRLR